MCNHTQNYTYQVLCIVAGGYKCTPIIYKCTPCGYMHPPTKVKTLKPGISITDKNLNQEWSKSTQDHEGLPEWQCWDYNPELHNITQEISCPPTDIVMRTTWKSGIQKMKIKLQKFGFGSGKHNQFKLSEITLFGFCCPLPTYNLLNEEYGFGKHGGKHSLFL